MNRQKLATIGCIILSIVYSLSLGLFIHFKLFLPGVNNTYEAILYYPEDLYEEYQKEVERMIVEKDYTSQYSTKATFYSTNGRTDLVIVIGNTEFKFPNYITVTVKNFGTNEQEVTFRQSKNSAEKAHEDAEKYRNIMRIYTGVFIAILVIFTVYLIINSIKRRYWRVFSPMLLIIGVMFILIFFYSILFE